jgi:SAM-dependent methyltransferase
MSEQGWDVTGLDVSIGTTRSIREDLGLRALSGNLPHPDLTPCSFDVATMWHSLEHVPYPMETLREVYQLLTPGGKLIVACPNIQSWSFRHFGTSWYGLDVPRHLTHFTANTLRLALQTSGFRIESLRTIRHSVWVRSSARLANASGQKSWMNRLLRWKPAAKLASWLAYSMGQSDCLIAVAERPK